MGANGSGSEVQISIVVVDKGGNETVQALGASLQEVEAKGVAAGEAAALALDQVTASTEAATAATQTFAEANAAALAAYMAQSKARLDPAAMQAMVAEGNAAMAAKQAAMEAAAATQTVEQAATRGAAASVGLAGSYGEARIAASALMGSSRGVAMGLANVGARAKWLAPMWQAAMPVAVGVAAVTILAQVGESLYDLYEKYIDLDAAANKYNDDVAKKKTEDFVDVHSIETARMRLDEATDSVTKLHDAAQNMRGGFWSDVFSGLNSGGFQGGLIAGVANLAGSRSLADASAQSAAQADALLEKQAQLQGRISTLRIEAAHAGDSELKGYAAINAELDKQIALHAQEAEIARGQEGARGNPVAQAGIGQYQRLQDEQAQAEASAKRVQLAEHETSEIMRLRAEALQAGLTGNALYAAQEVAAYDEINRKFAAGELSKQAMLAETADTERKFVGEAQKRQDELDARVRKSNEDAAMAGLTGIAKIQAETQAALAAIDEEESKAVGGGVETDAQKKDFAQLRANASGAGAQKQAEDQKQYFEQMDQMMAGFVDRSAEGYAKIYEDADKSAADVFKAWDERVGQMKQADDVYVAYTNKMSNAMTAIYANADREAARLHQQTMDSLRREEELAARESLPPWIAAEMAIVDTYNDRVNKAREALAQQKIDEDEYNAERVAANAVAEAQMQKQMEETRDKLASGLQSFFQNPQKYIEQRAMDTAFQYMGNEMMQLFQNHSTNPGVGMLGWLFGMNGQASTSTNANTFGRSLFGMHAPGLDSVSAGNTLSMGATTLQTGATTLQTAANTLLQYAGTGGGAGIGTNLAMPGFSGTSAASASTGLGSSVGSAAAGGIGAGSASISEADMAQLGGSTGPDATGTFSTIGGGLGQNAATSAGTAASPWMGAAGAAITGGMGIFSAYENSNPIAGGVSGAMSGAAIGSAITPGVGTAVGAVVGGIAGILAGVFGDKGKGAAQQLDWNTVQPGILTELRQYNSGQAGYNQVAQYLDQLQIEAMNQTNSEGSGARAWYQGHILPEIQAAQAQLAQEEKGGRSLVSLSAAQYHTGGMIGDFGDLGLNSSEGLILAQRGEMMMTAAAASSFAPALHAMNSGALSPGMLRGSQMVPASSASAAAPIQITAWDGKSVDTWLRNGGATKIRQAQNMGTMQYGGLGMR